MGLDRPQMNVTLAPDHGYRVGIVRASFNSVITEQQLMQAVEVLEAQNVPYDVIEVAGCFEITHALDRMAASGKYNALVALGALIKGDTIHFEVIAYSSGKAIMDLISKHEMPIGFGIITANTEEQAEERVNIGHDATVAVLDLLEKTKSL